MATGVPGLTGFDPVAIGPTLEVIGEWSGSRISGCSALKNRDFYPALGRASAVAAQKSRPVAAQLSGGAGFDTVAIGPILQVIKRLAPIVVLSYYILKYITNRAPE
jgi:hypothetical protein